MIKRLVVKIGSSLLTRPGGRLDEQRMDQFVKELSAIHKAGTEVLLVSSGAIAAGVGELGWSKRPSELPKKQAAAAIGQVRLMEQYRRHFSRRGILVAQVLLTREDFANKLRYHNAQATLLALLQAKAVPIINENDTVAVEEIRLGDNDTLAALVAVKVKADVLVLLTDVDGLMTQHPHQGKGEVIRVVEHISASIDALAQGGAGTDRGVGGMVTKIRAAKYATAHGVTLIIANGQISGTLTRIADGKSTGTLFRAQRLPAKISRPLDKLLINH